MELPNETWWAGLDSNQRRLSRRVYSPLQLPLCDRPVWLRMLGSNQHRESLDIETGFEPAIPPHNAAGFPISLLDESLLCYLYTNPQY